MYVSVLSLNLI